LSGVVTFIGGEMEITDVIIFLRDEPKLKAFVNIIFDQAFVIRGLKIIEGGNGLFISMPSRKRRNGHFQDIAHPVNMSMRQHIEYKVFEAYELKKAEKTSEYSDSQTLMVE
jgi:stage V sporulation protein G